MGFYKIKIVVVSDARRTECCAKPLLPFTSDRSNRLAWLIAAQFVICALGSLGPDRGLDQLAR